MRRANLLFACLALLVGAVDARAGSIFVDYQITGGTISPALGLPVAATGGTIRARFGHAVGPGTFSTSSGTDVSLLSLNAVGAGQNLQLFGAAVPGRFSGSRAYFDSGPNGPASWRTGVALSEVWPRVEAYVSLNPIFGAVRFGGFLTFRPRPGEMSEYYGGFNLLGQEVSRTYVPDAAEPHVALLGVATAALGACALARRRASA